MEKEWSQDRHKDTESWSVFSLMEWSLLPHNPELQWVYYVQHREELANLNRLWGGLCLLSSGNTGCPLVFIWVWTAVIYEEEAAGGVWHTLINLGPEERLCYFHGPEASVLDMAVPPSTIHIHSGFHPLITCSLRCNKELVATRQRRGHHWEEVRNHDLEDYKWDK